MTGKRAIMDLKTFLAKLNSRQETISFEETMQVIEANYTFTPTAFRNGDLRNEANQNSGSCKLFAFAKLHGFTPEQTLQCFGAYYREDVLNHPEGENHQNIRNFIRHGWEGILFDGQALTNA